MAGITNAEIDRVRQHTDYSPLLIQLADRRKSEGEDSFINQPDRI